jgi:hypothetical protein
VILAVDPGVYGAWIAAAGAVACTVIAGVLARRVPPKTPEEIISERHSRAMSEMDRALKQQGEMLDRQERRAIRAEERIATLEDEVEACELGREKDRVQHYEQLAELRSQIVSLKEGRD